MNNFKKCGFTLAELLVVIAITGIVIAACLSIAKPFEPKLKHSISNVYHGLARAFWNAYSEASDDIFDNSKGKDPKEKLCKALAEFINTTDSNCETAGLQNEQTINDPDKPPTPHIISGTGVKFYISKMTPATANIPAYFIVFADVNGKRGPNSTSYNSTNNIYPDIVPFALLSTGETVPLGPLEVDEHLLATRVSYENKNNELVYSKNSYEYCNAKSLAWGSSLSQKYDEQEVFTINDDLRKEINEKNFPSIKAGACPQRDTSADSNLTNTCNTSFFDNCYVVIEKYIQ